MLVLKIIAIALIVAAISLILKQYKPEMAMLVSLAGGAVVLFLLIGQFTTIFKWVDEIASKTGTNTKLLSPILKIIGIGYLAEFAASVCEDSGNKTMANKVVLGAKIVILILSLPVLSMIDETIVLK